MKANLIKTNQENLWLVDHKEFSQERLNNLAVVLNAKINQSIIAITEITYNDLTKEFNFILVTNESPNAFTVTISASEFQAKTKIQQKLTDHRISNLRKAIQKYSGLKIRNIIEIGYYANTNIYYFVVELFCGQKNIVEITRATIASLVKEVAYDNLNKIMTPMDIPTYAISRQTVFDNSRFTDRVA